MRRREERKSPESATRPGNAAVRGACTGNSRGFGLGRRSTGTRVSLILWSPADVIPSTCGSGGTGRRASLRSLFPKGSGGSSPLFRTTHRAGRSSNVRHRFYQRSADAKPVKLLGSPPLVAVLRPLPHNYWTYAAKLCNITFAPEYRARRGLGLDVHLLREGRSEHADEAEALSIQRIRLATGGVRGSTLEGAALLPCNRPDDGRRSGVMMLHPPST